MTFHPSAEFLGKRRASSATAERNGRRLLLGAGIFFAFAWPGVCTAQTALRWQLKTGENLAVTVTQNTVSEVAFAGKKTATNIELTMHLNWQVSSAAEGKIQIRQNLERFEFKMGSPNDVRVHYDSASAAPLTGQAKEIASAIAPLLKTALDITMNERGEILEAKTAEGTPELPGSLAADPAHPSSISKQSVQQLLKQPLAILPDHSVRPGETWTTKADLATSLGKFQQTTEYRYAGSESQDGTPLERIDIKSELALQPGTAADKLPKLKEQVQSGKVLFSAAAGRLNTAEQNQKLVTERPYRETTIVVTLTTKQVTQVAPAETAAKTQP